MTGAAAAAKPPLFELQDVSVEAGGRRILSHVDLAIAADAAGFGFEERVVEATGLCPDCRPAPGAAP